jgi:hypothetical protein
VTDRVEIERFAGNLATVAAELCGGVCTYHWDEAAGTVRFRLVAGEQVAGLLCRCEWLARSRHPERDAGDLAAALVKELGRPESERGPA